MYYFAKYNDMEIVVWLCTPALHPRRSLQKSDLSRWAARSETQAREKKKGLFERSEFPLFPRAGV